MNFAHFSVPPVPDPMINLAFNPKTETS